MLAKLSTGEANISGKFKTEIMHGMNMFKKFRVTFLEIQQRSIDDPKHTAINRALRNANVDHPFTEDIINYLHEKVISDEELRTLEWQRATYIAKVSILIHR